MSIPFSVYAPDPTLYSSYNQNLVYDIQKSLFALNSTVATFTNSLITQDLIANRPAPGQSGRIFYATDKHLFSYDNGSAWLPIASQGLFNVQIFSTAGAGVYTPTTGTLIIKVRAFGGGGGGGGAVITSSSTVAVGAGGGGGGYGECYIINPNSISYTVGSGGAGNAGGIGSAGSNTYFGSAGSILNCVPGSGGNMGAQTNGSMLVVAGSSGGTGYYGSGGIAGFGTAGPGGGVGKILVGGGINFFETGYGGNSIISAGGLSICNIGTVSSGSDGNPGTFGAGGGGAYNNYSQATARKGGNGGAGLIIVEEFG